MDGIEIDYAKVLEDLKNRRDKLNSAIAGIEEMLGLTWIEPCRPGLAALKAPETAEGSGGTHDGRGDLVYIGPFSA